MFVLNQSFLLLIILVQFWWVKNRKNIFLAAKNIFSTHSCWEDNPRNPFQRVGSRETYRKTYCFYICSPAIIGGPHGFLQIFIEKVNSASLLPWAKPRSFIGEVPHCLGSRRTQRSARWGWVGTSMAFTMGNGADVWWMYGGCTSKVIFWCFFLGGEGLPILGNTMGCNLMILGYMEKNTSKLVVEWGYLRVIELTWISSAGLSSSSRIQCQF